MQHEQFEVISIFELFRLDEQLALLPFLDFKYLWLIIFKILTREQDSKFYPRSDV